ncbi:MAG: replication initiation protein [Dysgonomonas sp.]
MDYLIKKNKDKHYPDLVVQANEITLAKYSYDLIEKRVLYKIIDKVRTRFVEEKHAEGTSEDLFGNFTIRFTPAELREVDNMNRIYDKLTEFKKKSFEINNEEEWSSINLLTRATHRKKENYFEMEISPAALKYFVELSSRFTAYSLSVALSFNSTYTQRFYELCQMWRIRGFFEYTVEELRELFGLETAYKTYGEFKRAVIDKAQKELYKSYTSDSTPKSDVYFKCEVKKKEGKRNNKIKELIFYIYEVSENLYGNWQVADYLYNIRTKIAPLFANDTKYVDRILKSLGEMEAPYLNSVWVKIQDKLVYYASKDVTERAKVIRTILKEDFKLF